jgi:ATP-dependent Clp protease ATP-binding subunit ClpA
LDLPLSHECKRILAYAAEEAERLNHRHIGTEHLMLGILREEKCLAANILQERGLRLDRIREELARAVVERPGATDPKLSHAPPKDAMVPDEATARLIAQAIWTAAYSTEAAAINGAVQVTINSGSWQISEAVVRGHSKPDGKVIAMGRAKTT